MDEKERIRGIGDLMNEAMEGVGSCGDPSERIANGPAIPSGLKELDFCLHGWHPGDVIVVAGGMGVGKTTFAVQAGMNAARSGARVDLFTLGLEAELVAVRMAASSARVPIGKILMGCLSEGDAGALRDAKKRLRALALNVCDDRNLGIDELRDLAVDGAGGEGKRLIVVDGLDRSCGEHGRLDLGLASSRLKELAVELDCPVIMTVGVGGKKARMLRRKKCRVGAALELVDGAAGHADVVLVLDRSLDEVEAELNGAPPLNTMEVIVAKNKWGGLPEVTLAYIPEYLRLMDYAHDYYM